MFSKSLFFLILLFYSLGVCAENIPVIVISSGKTIQNKNTVGSDISSIEQIEIENSSSFFVGDLLDENLNSLNFSQSGGYGTNSLIQLRGFPKRYTNIYIDGVKMSDPSSPDNAFYFNNLTINGIERVEVLKGSQSSLYGSGAIAGAINITTKKGDLGNHQKVALFTGSNNTKNLNLSFDGKNNNHNYFIGLNTFLTDGISAMNDNDEKDGYKNNSVVTNYGYKINNFFKIENGLRLSKSILNYDEVTSGRLDNNKTEDKEISYSFKILTDNQSGIKNNISYNKTKIERKVFNYNQTSLSNYSGYRDSVNLLGEYNINLDSKIVYGLDNEFDAANYKTWATSGYKEADEAIYGQYFDLHLRPLAKLYTTFGARRDHHTTAGDYNTYRITGAYRIDSDTKLRSSFGTGIRFPSLNDYFYDANISQLENLKPEKSKSFDIGLDKSFDKYKINLSVSLFRNEYKDNISNWASNTDNGNNPSGYSIENSSGKITSKGIELSSNFNPTKKLIYSLDYSYTKAYDGEDCDDPDKSSSTCALSSYPVRIPKHQINASIKNTFQKKLESKLNFKYTSSRRDYGNVNNSFEDVILKDYIVINLKNKINFYGSNFYFDINNIFNEKYEGAYQYSSQKRSFNFGFNRIF